MLTSATRNAPFASSGLSLGMSYRTVDRQYVKMGIKDFSDFLARIEVFPQTLHIPPGKRFAIDAMMMYHSAMEACSKPYIDDAIRTCPYPTRPRVEDAKQMLIQNIRHVDFKPSLDGETFLNYDCFAPETLSDGTPTREVLIREGVVVRMANDLTGFLTSGCIPILIWDGSVVGAPRNPHKLPRSSVSLLRPVDRTYVFEVLRKLGFPSVVAWTEGEKVCCAAVQAGSADIVMSGDADIHILGAPVTVDRAVPRMGVGNGMMSEGAHFGQDILNAAARLTEGRGPPLVRLIDAALFLGCDFVMRLPRNGPATLIKEMKTATEPFAQKLYREATCRPDIAQLAPPAGILFASEFFTVTEEDRKRAEQLVTSAMVVAGKPDENALVQLRIYDKLQSLFGRIANGPVSLSANTNYAPYAPPEPRTITSQVVAPTVQEYE